MIEKIILANGVHLFLEQIERAKSAAVGIWINAGTAHEQEHQAGMAHFIEHMVFKGTDRRSAKEIANEFDEIGAHANAYTTKELICLHAHVLSEETATAIDLLADMLLHPRLDQADMEHEKNIVLEELNEYLDSPDDLCLDKLIERVYAGSVLAGDILGTPQSIGSFTSENLRQYMKENFTAENIMVCVCGGFERTQVLAKLQDCFAFLPARGYENLYPVDCPYTPTILPIDKATEQNYLTLCYPALPYGQRQNHQLALLNQLFGASMSSRLFQKIREEEGLAYSVYSYCVTFRPAGIFAVGGSFVPENEKQVLDLILAEICRLVQDGVEEHELRRAKKQLRANILMAFEGVSTRMSHIGKTQLLLGDTPSPEEMVHEIDRVTIAEVNAMARRILRPELASLCLVGKPSLSQAGYEALIRRPYC